MLWSKECVHLPTVPEPVLMVTSSFSYLCLHFHPLLKRLHHHESLFINVRNPQCALETALRFESPKSQHIYILG